MSQIPDDNRSGPRYLVSFPVHAEWDTPDGQHFAVEGTTENIGPGGTLVHFQRDLPDVGNRVQLQVQGTQGEKLDVLTEVLRLERNAGHPLAALQLVEAFEEWRGVIWGAAAEKIASEKPDKFEDDDLFH